MAIVKPALPILDFLWIPVSTAEIRQELYNGNWQGKL